MKNVSLTNEVCRKSKRKRLTDNIKQKNLSSHAPALHIPQMSENALKRWREARDTYLGDQHPYIEKHRKIKPKNKTTKKHNEETKSFFTVESNEFSRTDLQHLPLEQQQQEPQIMHDQVDDKCVGTEIDESILFETHIEQIDEATQADLPSPELELHPEYDTNMIEDEKKQEIQADQESIEYDDKGTETDLILDTKKEDEVDRQSTKETLIDSIPNIPNQIAPINDDDTKTILSSNQSNISLHEQLRRYFPEILFFFI